MKPFRTFAACDLFTAGAAQAGTSSPFSRTRSFRLTSPHRRGWTSPGQRLKRRAQDDDRCRLASAAFHEEGNCFPTWCRQARHHGARMKPCAALGKPARRAAVTQRPRQSRHDGLLARTEDRPRPIPRLHHVRLRTGDRLGRTGPAIAVSSTCRNSASKQRRIQVVPLEVNPTQLPAEFSSRIVCAQRQSQLRARPPCRACIC